MRIDGATRLYAILGDPIAQVKSPAHFCAALAAAGRNAVMLPVHVLPERFDATVPELQGLGNLDGLLFTVPYKARAVRFADRLGPTAGRIGALNALRREADGSWSGEMFDGAGFVRGALRKGCALRGRRVALYGAGGAGSAIACELAAEGVASLAIIDPQRERAAELAAVVARAFADCTVSAAEALPAGTNMIVNASTVGMHDGDALPGAIGALAPDTIVGDVVIAPRPTPLIRLALERGCVCVDGRDMFAGQSDALIAFFGWG